MEEHVLQTKLHIPSLRPSLVPRPHLIERLNHGVQSGCKLTLVPAPAGFGKTTLITDWGSQISESINPQSAFNAPQLCWLSLDEGDNDPARFLVYFIAALKSVNEDIGKIALSLLQSPQPPPSEVVLTTLINDIIAAAAPIILVLDDYHVIHTPPIHQQLAFLLDHLPPQLHLVILTREDPLLPVGRLRARGELLEIHQDDLRFTIEEMTHKHFYQHCMEYLQLSIVL